MYCLISYLFFFTTVIIISVLVLWVPSYFHGSLFNILGICKLGCHHLLSQLKHKVTTKDTVLHFTVFDLNVSVTDFMRQTFHGQPSHNEADILSKDVELWNSCLSLTDQKLPKVCCVGIISLCPTDRRIKWIIIRSDTVFFSNRDKYYFFHSANEYIYCIKRRSILAG